MKAIPRSTPLVRDDHKPNIPESGKTPLKIPPLKHFRRGAQFGWSELAVPPLCTPPSPSSLSQYMHFERNYNAIYYTIDGRMCQQLWAKSRNFVC